jgi:hypothetical protein
MHDMAPHCTVEKMKADLEQARRMEEEKKRDTVTLQERMKRQQQLGNVHVMLARLAHRVRACRAKQCNDPCMQLALAPSLLEREEALKAKEEAKRQREEARKREEELRRQQEEEERRREAARKKLLEEEEKRRKKIEKELKKEEKRDKKVSPLSFGYLCTQFR